MSIDAALVQRLSNRLVTARADRRAIAPLSDDHPNITLATGYEVQLAGFDGDQVGWKLGVTSRAKQRQVGIDAPIYGMLGAADALDIAEPLVVASHIQPRVEPEIALLIGEDLDGAHVTASDVLRATEAVAVAMEVLDSRYEAYRFTMPDVVADNASLGRFVVGDWVEVRGIDLRLVGVVLEHRGDVVASAAGAASLGHPAAAVAWLVRALAAAGDGLETGDVIMSGGLTAAVPVAAGDSVVTTIDRLGSLVLACV